MSCGAYASDGFVRANVTNYVKPSPPPILIQILASGSCFQIPLACIPPLM